MQHDYGSVNSGSKLLLSYTCYYGSKLLLSYTCYYGSKLLLNYQANISIDNKQIQQVNKSKALGTIVDQHLSWKPNTENMQKITSGISALRRVKPFIAERGQGRQEGGGGQNTWGPDWLGGPKS